MSAKKAAGKKSALESPHQALVRLQQEIASGGHPDFAALVFSEPIDAAEIAAAEQRLGVAPPPSYVELVTQHGLFKLSGTRQPSRASRSLTRSSSSSMVVARCCLRETSRTRPCSFARSSPTRTTKS